jgi:carboxypeptidase C (cathepsin A)
MKKTLLLPVFLFALLISFAPLMAQTIVKDSLSIPKEEKSVTRHSVTIDGKLITYTATAGALILRNDLDEPIAFYGYTAYTKDGQSDPAFAVTEYDAHILSPKCQRDSP